MADITNPEMIGLERQRALAQALLKQGMQTPEGQMISGRYVPVNPLEFIGNAVQTYRGNELAKEADVQQQTLAEKLRQQGVAEVGDILTLAQGRPELPSQELAGPAYQGVAPSIQYPAVAGDTQAALAKALTGVSPQAQALAPSLLQNLLPKKTDKLIEYDTYKKEGGKKSFSDWSREITPEQEARLAIDRQRLGLEGARLGLEQQKLAAELGGAKLNEEQGKAVGFGTRAKEASEILKNLEAKGITNTGIIRSSIASTLGMTPLIGDKLEQNAMTALNTTASPEQQSTLQARKNFATAVLRKESGASISPTEFADVDRIYFPQPGDNADLLKQKQRARDLAIQSLETQAGPGARFIREFKPQTEFGGQESTGGWSVKSVK